MTRTFILTIMTTTVILTVLASGCIGLLGYYNSDQLGPVEWIEAQSNNVYIALSWHELEGASLYNVYRDGTMLAQTNITAHMDPMVEHGEEYRYKVAGVREANAMFDAEGVHSQEVGASLDPIAYDDTGFVPFFRLSSEIIEDTLTKIELAAASYLFSEVRDRASVLESVSSRYLQHTEEFELSESLEPARAYYAMALENFTLAGQHFGEGAHSFNAHLITLAGDHVERGYEHLEAARGLLP